MTRRKDSFGYGVTPSGDTLNLTSWLGHTSRLSLSACLLIAGIVLLISALPALAQDELPKAFKCEFRGNGQFTVYEGGKFVSQPAGPMDLTFAALDFSAGTAQMIGNIGAATVKLIAGEHSIHLIEMTKAGNINLTTVYLKVSADGRFVAVHSRHVGTSGDPMVTQAYGLCTPLW